MKQYGRDDPNSQSHQLYFNSGTQGCWYVGARAELDRWATDDAHQLIWKGTLRDADFDEIQTLRLVPSPYQIRKPRLPPYLSKLTRASQLSMPVPLLTVLRADTMPALRTLSLGLDERFTDGGKQIPEWPRELLLPGLRCLNFWEPNCQEPEWHKLDVRAANVPGLELMKVLLDHKGKGLEMIARLGSLRHLFISRLRNFDAVFAAVPATLEHLNMNSAGRGFSLAGLTRLSVLRSLDLWYVTSEIDCRIFTELPGLEQLDLMSSKKLTHIDALLECPKLEWLRVVACGRPIKGALAAKFEARGFGGFTTQFS